MEERFRYAVALMVAGTLLLAGCTLSSESPGGRTYVPPFPCKACPETDLPPTGQIGLRIQYHYDLTARTLHIRHIDTLLNCCPQIIGAKVTVAGQRIEAAEYQDYRIPCAGLCLHDLEYSVEGISPVTYFLYVSVLYARSECEAVPPIFNFGPNDLGPLLLDLADHPSGSFFFDRDYSWAY